MCGICVYMGSDSNAESHVRTAIKQLEPRGPDSTTVVTRNDNTAIGFARLHVQGVHTATHPEQPFLLADGRHLVCNGEIFNAAELTRQLNLSLPTGSSDCAVIPALLNRGLTLPEVCRLLDGDFAIVVVSDRGVEAARDPYGVRPLYYGAAAASRPFCFASEVKGLCANTVDQIHAVEPGTALTMDSTGVRPTRWHEVPWLKHPEGSTMQETLLESLRVAVSKRLTTVRGIGACLSGGLDSSLVAALAARALTSRGGPRLHTYSIGMTGSPDLIAARLVAAHIGSIHHERIITADDCLAAVPAVIRAIETFDTTTVRASVGNWLLGAFIREVTPDVKVVLNGDGADELLGGYRYMRAAPDDAAFERETTRLLSEIHLYDVARSERSMAAHGLESRSPFLDRQLVSVARSIPTHLLRPSAERMEKWILRHAADATSLLPAAVVWRPKEAFSDGISEDRASAWFQKLADAGKEAPWYRALFYTAFGAAAAAAATTVTPALWMPRWIDGATDPSARTWAVPA